MAPPQSSARGRSRGPRRAGRRARHRTWRRGRASPRPSRDPACRVARRNRARARRPHARCPWRGARRGRSPSRLATASDSGGRRPRHGNPTRPRRPARCRSATRSPAPRARTSSAVVRPAATTPVVTCNSNRRGSPASPPARHRSSPEPSGATARAISSVRPGRRRASMCDQRASTRLSPPAPSASVPWPCTVPRARSVEYESSTIRASSYRPEARAASTVTPGQASAWLSASNTTAGSVVEPVTLARRSMRPRGSTAFASAICATAASTDPFRVRSIVGSSSPNVTVPFACNDSPRPVAVRSRSERVRPSSVSTAAAASRS